MAPAAEAELGGACWSWVVEGARSNCCTRACLAEIRSVRLADTTIALRRREALAIVVAEEEAGP